MHKVRGETEHCSRPCLVGPCWECEAVAWREFTEEEFASETDLSDLLRLHSDYIADYLASDLGSLYEEDVESSEWAKLLGKLVRVSKVSEMSKPEAAEIES